MNDSGCSRWADLSDRAALGERLSDEERRFEHRHLSECPACAAEACVWQALRGLLSEDASAPSRLLEGATGQSDPPRLSKRSWSTLRVAAAAASAAACAAGIVLWFGLPSALQRSDIESKPLAGEGRVTVASVSGTTTVEGATAIPGMVLGSGQVVEVRQGRMCLVYSPGVTVCAASGSVLRPVDSERASRLMLEKGRVVCQLDARPAGGDFSVTTPRGRVTAKGTVFAVEFGEGCDLAVRLHRGKVEVESPTGERRELRAPAALLVAGMLRDVPTTGAGWQEDFRLLEGGERFAEDSRSPLDAQDPEAPDGTEEALSEREAQHRPTVMQERKPRVAQPSADELLALAGKLRASGRFAQAGATYEALLRQHPGSVAARAALVSLAELQLSRLGQPGKALGSFDAYLSQGGPLGQEARYGRIRALRRLGRLEEARAATQLFLRDYSGSPQAEALRDALPER